MTFLGLAMPNQCCPMLSESKYLADLFAGFLGKKPQSLFMTRPAKIGHVGSQNLTTFQTIVTRNFILQHGMATQFSESVHNLTGFPTHFTELKCYISVLRYVSSNHIVYFSPHALFS